MTDLRITHLDHGLRVVTEHVPGTLSVAAGAWVGVGARDETDVRSGASHFLEHLLFKGTATRSALDISRAIDRCGGDINAFTGKEYTAFVARVPERHAPIAVDLLGDILTAPALRDDDVDTERQVILEEMAMDDDSPDDVAHRAFAEELFSGHPLGRETAGTRPSIEAMPAEEIRSFFAEHYRTGSMVVSVAGPRPHDEMLALVEAAFAGVPGGDGRLVRQAPVEVGSGRRIVDDTEQVHLVWGGRGLARDDKDREALDVVNHVLGGGLSSRLFDVVREQRGLVYGIASFATSYADCGAWTISAGTSPHHVDEVLELVAEQLELLRRDGITTDELEIAHGALTGTFALGLEDTGSRMSRNGALLCTRGHIPPVDEQIRRWLDVDLDDTRRVLERVFTADPIVVTVGPR